MSHFLTAVIVPPMPDEADILDKVEELLAPYDQNGEWNRERSRWDWRVIGGRWDGQVTGCDPAPWSLLTPPEFILERNITLVDERHPDFVPWAIVTPDGAWHERAHMEWCIQPRAVENPAWPGRAEEIFARYPDHLLVAVDCHV